MTDQQESKLKVLARQTVLDEIKFRMEKLWRIFSWTSTVLIAITGGTIALRTGDNVLSDWHEVILAVAPLVVALYAVVWLRQNLRLEAMARNALEAHDTSLGIAEYNEAINGGLPRPDIGIIVGYKLTVIMLAAAAVAAALVPLPC